MFAELDLHLPITVPGVRQGAGLRGKGKGLHSQRKKGRKKEGDTI